MFKPQANRPFRQTLLLSTIVIGFTTFGAVILYAVTMVGRAPGIADEKRFQVFQELTRTIAAAFQRINVQISDLANFDAATEKARYLFGAAANHGNLPDQLDEGVGAMTQINLPHVLHTFDTSDRGRRILNVATDLTAKPTAPGYDAEALDDLRRALGKLIDRRKGYAQIVLLHFSPVVAYDLADH
jgi:hypothetical protein